MTLLKFELLKILKNKFYYLGILILLILFTYPLFIYPDNEKIYENNINQLEANIDMSRNAIISNGDNSNTEEINKIIEEDIQLQQQLLLAYQNQDNQKIIEGRLEFDKNNLDGLINGTLAGTSVTEVKKDIGINEYLLKHNLERIEPYAIQVPAINYLYSLTSTVIPFKIILLMLGLMLGSIFTNEKRNNNINVLNALPINLYKISLLKVVTATAFVILTLIVPFIIIFLIIASIYGVGDLNYPMAYSFDLNTVEVTTLTTYIVKYFLLSILSIILIGLISYLLSLFTGNIMFLVMILVVIIFIADPKLINSDVLTTYAHILPTTYFNVQDILLGQVENNPLPNFLVTYQNGLITLLVSIIFVSFLIFTTLFFKKKL